jgi:hypothetical protein
MDILTVTCLVLAGVIVGWLVHEARDMIDEMREDRMEEESWH